MDKLSYKLRSGKNSKFAYYLTNYIRLVTPKIFFRTRLKNTLESCNARDDREYITERVNYYNKLTVNTPLPKSTPKIGDYRPKGQKVYFFDTYQYARWFPQSLKLLLLPGDITYVPEYPSIVKSRPLTDKDENSVIMKLDKVRHLFS